GDDRARTCAAPGQARLPGAAATLAGRPRALRLGTRADPRLGHRASDRQGRGRDDAGRAPGRHGRSQPAAVDGAVPDDLARDLRRAPDRSADSRTGLPGQLLSDTTEGPAAALDYRSGCRPFCADIDKVSGITSTTS